MKKTSTLPALAATALLAAAPAAFAQDPGEPPPADAAEFVTTVSAPKSMSKAQLKKGVTITVTCTRACSAAVQISSVNGVMTKKTVKAGPTATKVKLKAPKIYLDLLKKGGRIDVGVNARASDDGAAHSARAVSKVK